MKNRYFLTLFLLLSALSLSAENRVKGVVFSIEGDNQKRPLIGAIINWTEGKEAVTTDENGEFEVKKSRQSNQLIASFIGYNSDTIKVSESSLIEFTLSPLAVEVDEVVIQGRASNLISAISPEKKEIITFAGLCKMACCNLAESFENSASVTVGYSDAVSGARQIKLLGYSGTYTQMLDETRPIMRGLSSIYGLEYTPGMWLSGIQISKGVTSVVNGYEALTGQINIEHRKPTDEEQLFVNLFLSSELRTEANITSALKVNDKLSTVILTHVSMDQMEMDDNDDGFVDLPVKKQYNVGNRWLYAANNGTQIRFGLRALYEERRGGQVDFVNSDRTTLNHYGSNIENRDFNAYVKVGIPIRSNRLSEDDPEYLNETTSNIALVTDYVHHDQEAFFGLKDYDGDQSSFYSNLLYQVNYGESHKLITGATFTADLYNESFVDGFTTGGSSSAGYTISKNSYNFDRNLFTTGAFGEYTYSIAEKLDVIAGFRADYNNKYGWMLTPRSHVKWNVTDRTTLRASAGMGHRIMSLLTDNIGMLATGRELSFADDLNLLESGYTAGGSITQTFRLGSDNNASLSLDFFRSQLSDQVVVDQESDASKILFYNLTGDSYTNTYQIDFSYVPFERFSIFATYRYNDTKLTYQNSQDVITPLINKFKGLVNVQYATKFDKWTFDFTAQLNGQSRIPTQIANFSAEEFSPVYPMFFGQVTRKFKNLDIYIGCENIGNYTQSNPILSSNDPFSTQFNSTVVWGPIMGRKFYGGLRYTLK